MVIELKLEKDFDFLPTIIYWRTEKIRLLQFSWLCFSACVKFGIKSSELIKYYNLWRSEYDKRGME